MGTKRNIKVRFHLGKGKNFMKWRVENLETDQVEFYDPNDYDLVMDLVNCKLYNQKGAANKIHAGANKSVCAWIMCESIVIFRKSPQCYSRDLLSYNPKKAPYWRQLHTMTRMYGATGCIADGKTYDHLFITMREIQVVK